MEAVEELQRKFEEKRNQFTIARVPPAVRKEFFRLSESLEAEFVGDYGFLLKDMIEKYKFWREGLIPGGTQEIMLRIQDLESSHLELRRTIALLQVKATEKDVVRSVDGSRVLRNKT